MLEELQRPLNGSRRAFPGRHASICLAAILIAALSLTPIFGRAPGLTLAFSLVWLIKRRWTLSRALLIFAAFALLHTQGTGWLQALSAAVVFLVAHGLRKWVRQSADVTILASCIVFPILIIAGWVPLVEALRSAAGFALGAAAADLAIAAGERGQRPSPGGKTYDFFPVAALAAIINILSILLLDTLVGLLAGSVDEKTALSYAFIGERLTLPAFFTMALLLQLYSRWLSRALEPSADDASIRPLQMADMAGSGVATNAGAATDGEGPPDAVAEPAGTPTLRSITALTLDEIAGRLEFYEGTPSNARSLQIHVDDIRRVLESADRGDTILTFRAMAGSDFEPMLLAMTGRAGKWRWESGILLLHGQQRHYSIALAQRARHADLGARVMAIAHELRQPLFTIAVAAESQRLLLVRADESNRSMGQLTERIERITEQVSRATTIIEQVLNYGRASASKAAELDVADTLRRSCAFLAPMLEERAIELDFAIENGWHCTFMSPVELEQVFVNALQNAADSIVSRRHGGWTGTGCIRCSVVTCNGLISCDIADNGAGVSPHHAEAAFDAFFSTKADEGTGLGLFITREIILRAGGGISLRPSSEGGALLAIQLPATTHVAQMSARASRIVN